MALESLSLSSVTPSTAAGGNFGDVYFKTGDRAPLNQPLSVQGNITQETLFFGIAAALLGLIIYLKYGG